MLTMQAFTLSREISFSFGQDMGEIQYDGDDDNPFAHAATSNVNSTDNYMHKEIQGAHIKSSQ